MDVLEGVATQGNEMIVHVVVAFDGDMSGSGAASADGN